MFDKQKQTSLGACAPQSKQYIANEHLSKGNLSYINIFKSLEGNRCAVWRDGDRAGIVR
jgi:hypothetical protein